MSKPEIITYLFYTSLFTLKAFSFLTRMKILSNLNMLLIFRIPLRTLLLVNMSRSTKATLSMIMTRSNIFQ